MCYREFVIVRCNERHQVKIDERYVDCNGPIDVDVEQCVERNIEAPWRDENLSYEDSQLLCPHCIRHRVLDEDDNVWNEVKRDATDKLAMCKQTYEAMIFADENGLNEVAEAFLATRDALAHYSRLAVEEAEGDESEEHQERIRSAANDLKEARQKYIWTENRILELRSEMDRYSMLVVILS